MAESSPLFGFDPGTTTVVGNYSKVAEAQGDIADAAAQSKSQQAPFDFLGLGKQVGNLAGMFADEKNMVDAHQAKLRATEYMQNNDYKSGHELAKGIEDQIKTISDDNNYSSGYRKGALAVLDVGYAQALERKEEERVASVLNVLSSNFSADIANNFANGIEMTEAYAQEWAGKMSTQWKVPVEYVRNAMVSSLYQDAQMRVITATNSKQLAAAEAYITRASSVLKSPLFLDTRSKKFQPVVNGLKKNLDSSITAKKKEFQQAAALTIATDFEGTKEDVFSSFPKDPNTPEAIATLTEAYPNPATRFKKWRELQAGFAEAQEARDYITSYNVYGEKPAVPVKSDNKYIMPAIEDLVYSELVQVNPQTGTITFASPSKMAQIANLNPDVIASAGDKFYHALTTTHRPEVLQQFHEQLNTTRNIPGGSRALQLMFGDNYKEVVGLSLITDTLAKGDVAKARDIIAESGGSYAGEPPINPDIKDDYYKYMGKLGTLGDEFSYVISTINKANPGLVNKALLERVYTDLSGGYQERAGVKYNVSKFDSSSKAFDPDVFNEQISSMATAFNGGVAPSEIMNLPKDIMVYKDEFGFTAGVFNAGPALYITNGLATAIANSDAKAVDFWTKSGDTFDTVQSYLADTLPNVFDWSSEGIDKAFASDAKLFRQLDLIWGTEDVPREKISKDILQFKAMFPEVIDESVIPDLDERKAAETRNAQMQILIEEIATRFLGGRSLEQQQRSEEFIEKFEKSQNMIGPNNGYGIWFPEYNIYDDPQP